MWFIKWSDLEFSCQLNFFYFVSVSTVERQLQRQDEHLQEHASVSLLPSMSRRDECSVSLPLGSGSVPVGHQSRNWPVQNRYRSARGTDEKSV